MLRQNISVSLNLVPLASELSDPNWLSAAMGSALFVPSVRLDSVVPLRVLPRPLRCRPKNMFFNYFYKWK